MSALAQIVTAFGNLGASQAQAQMAENSARQAEQEAAVEEAARRRKTAADLGRIRTRFLANGLTPSGSPQDVVDTEAENAELEALTIHYRGDVQATRLRNEARLARARGDTAFVSDILRGGQQAATDGYSLGGWLRRQSAPKQSNGAGS